MPTLPPGRCPRCHRPYRGRRCPSCTGWGSDARTGRTRGLATETTGSAQWVRINATPALRRAWAKVRGVVLARDLLCRMCSQARSVQADHLDGTNYQDDSGLGTSWLNPDMCRGLCAACHRARTSRQAGAL